MKFYKVLTFLFVVLVVFSFAGCKKPKGDEYNDINYNFQYTSKNITKEIDTSFNILGENYSTNLPSEVFSNITSACTITVTSSNQSVAKITDTINITTLSVGAARIDVSITYNNKTVTDYFNLTVINSSSNSSNTENSPNGENSSQGGSTQTPDNDNSSNQENNGGSSEDDTPSNPSETNPPHGSDEDSGNSSDNGQSGGDNQGSGNNQGSDENNQGSGDGNQSGNGGDSGGNNNQGGDDNNNQGNTQGNGGNSGDGEQSIGEITYTVDVTVAGDRIYYYLHIFKNGTSLFYGGVDYELNVITGDVLIKRIYDANACQIIVYFCDCVQIEIKDLKDPSNSIIITLTPNE